MLLVKLETSFFKQMCRKHCRSATKTKCKIQKFED